MTHRAKGLRSLATLVARATGTVVSGSDYAATLERLGIGHDEAAKRMGVSRRSSERWAHEGAPPEMVDKL